MTDELVSVRGLVDSDFDLPVREFDGIFDGYETAPATGYEGTRVNLNYKDIDNVVAVSPYNLPTVVLNMSLTNKKKTRFGYYGDSLGNLNSPDEDIKDWRGQKHHLVLTDGQDGRPAPDDYKIWSRDEDTRWKHSVEVENKVAMIEKKRTDASETELQELGNLKEELASMEEVYPRGMVPTPVWVVTAVDGAGVAAAGDSGQSAADWAEENLIGKTRAEFNKWFYADAKCRKDTALQRTVNDKSFINSLIQLNRIEENEDGVFQVPV